MKWLQTLECDIRIDRGKRYGNAEDTLANVRRGGWMGCILSANECMERLWTMYDNKMNHGIDPDPDDLLNAVNDLRNFAGYIANLFGICTQFPEQDVHVCACSVNKKPGGFPAYIVDEETGEKVLLDPNKPHTPNVVPWAGNVTMDPISNEVAQ